MAVVCPWKKIINELMQQMTAYYASHKDVSQMWKVIICSFNAVIRERSRMEFHTFAHPPKTVLVISVSEVYVDSHNPNHIYVDFGEF